MKKSINAIGKVCPLPVVQTKKAIVDLVIGDQIEIEVDNYIAVQNLAKMAEQKKLTIHSDKKHEHHYVVTLTITETPITKEESLLNEVEVVSIKENNVIVIGSDRMGEGDEKLGKILMKGFIYALTEQEKLPNTVLLYNTGVYLSTTDSDSIADLAFLQEQGVEILSCGTCLNHYNLAEQLAVGDVTNMYVILEKQMQATKVIKA